MKLGSENRNKVIALAVLGGIALLLIVRAFIPDSAPAPAPVAALPNTPPTTAPAKPPARGKASAKKTGQAHAIDPSLRYDWLKASEDTKYEGNGRNIFMAQADIPKPEASGVTDKKKEEATGPPPPPPPPPINLKFYGYASGPGEPKKIFLSQGEDLFVAAEGDVVDRRYKILHIAPFSVEIEDMLNNNRQNIPLTQS